MTEISPRILNRTLLDRQFLLSRESRSALGIIERLVALQSQEPNWPYIGLWARAADFHIDELMWLLTTRQVVRGAGLRRTQHLMASSDVSGCDHDPTRARSRLAQSRDFTTRQPDLMSTNSLLLESICLGGTRCRGASSHGALQRSGRVATVGCSPRHWNSICPLCIHRAPVPGVAGEARQKWRSLVPSPSSDH